jgi:phytoene dehydrogenase-like protein
MNVDVVIAGGGHNGLVAAFYLARAGLTVAVFERRSAVGGACATEELFPGYKFSTCSYLCGMLHPRIIRDLDLARHGFRYWRANPLVTCISSSDRGFLMWRKADQTRHEIGRVNRKDGEAFDGWCSFWDRANALLHPFLLRPPPTQEEVKKLALRHSEERLLDELTHLSIADVCERYFTDPWIQASLVHVEDVGDPRTPGSAFVEAYFHPRRAAALGPAIPRGGMGAVATAMARAAVGVGANIETDCEIRRIIVNEGRAIGVQLQSGREVRARIVLSNLDPKHTASLVEDNQHAARPEVKLPATQAAYLKFHAVVSRVPDVARHLPFAPPPRAHAHIQIAASLDQYAAAYSEMKGGAIVARPVVHIQVPTAYDPTLTGRKGHVLSIWSLYAPPRLAHGSWDERRHEAALALIKHVDEYVPGFCDSIEDWALFTPSDLEARLGMTDGNIRHVDMIPSQFFASRLGSGPFIADGLFLCGAGTHPGGEVTGAPGYNAAAAVLRYVREER